MPSPSRPPDTTERSPTRNGLAIRVREAVQTSRSAMVELLRQLVEMETPSTDASAATVGLQFLGRKLTSVGLQVGYGDSQSGKTGGWLTASSNSVGSEPIQLLVGHVDTVWPKGTLEAMPWRFDGDVVKGPGSFDMKAGLVQIVFALRAARQLELDLPLQPVVFVNTDEEIGSPDSTAALKELAAQAHRAFILEPALGPSGALKTRRKGATRYTVEVRGRSAHAGLDPSTGSNAIAILAEVVQALFALNDPERGVSVNVGMIEGGTRPNVVPESARAVVDVRTPTREDADDVRERLNSIQVSPTRGSVTIAGTAGRPPMEASAGSRLLWRQAHTAAEDLGFDLEESMAGGASDGNTTSQFCPTLDGLGGVGGGAHAAHEHILVDRLVERTALLVLLITAPDALREGHAAYRICKND